MRGGQFFFPGIDHFHRPSFAEPGEGHGNGFGDHGPFSPESTPRVSGNKADLVDGNPQGIGQFLGPAEGSIGGGPDEVIFFGREVLGHRSMGFHGGVGDGMDVKFIFKKLVGFGKTCSNISPGVSADGTEVGSRDALVGSGMDIFAESFMEKGCVFSQGFPRIEDGWQLLVLNLDSSQGFLGLGFSGGGYGYDRFPHVAHPVDGQKRLVADHAAKVEGKIFPGHDSLNPPGLPNFGEVDLDDPGMGPWASQNGPVKHPGKIDIHAINRPARYLLYPLYPGHPLSHILTFHFPGLSFYFHQPLERPR